MMEYDGILRIEILQGSIFKNTEVWGKMDPYVVLKYQKIKLRTRVHGDGGSNPVWS
jgi:Ca2+-dependent lipid-binding protein